MAYGVPDICDDALTVDMLRDRARCGTRCATRCLRGGWDWPDCDVTAESGGRNSDVEMDRSKMSDSDDRSNCGGFFESFGLVTHPRASPCISEVPTVVTLVYLYVLMLNLIVVDIIDIIDKKSRTK